MGRQRKRVLVPLAPGFEETEGIAPADVLSRAGIEPVLAHLTGQDPVVVGSHRLAVQTDRSIADVDLDQCVGLCLPGGMPGTEHLLNTDAIGNIATHFFGNGGLVGAICAGPLVLQQAGLTRGKRLTSHPSIKERLIDCIYEERPVVVDHPLITSRGPGTALLFGLTIVAALVGRDAARALADKMVVAVPDIVQSEWAHLRDGI